MTRSSLQHPGDPRVDLVHICLPSMGYACGGSILGLADGGPGGHQQLGGWSGAEDWAEITCAACKAPGRREVARIAHRQQRPEKHECTEHCEWTQIPDESAPLAYDDFLAEKVNFDSACGFDVDVDEVHPLLKPHQRDIVRWAVAGGRRAIFAAFGLGKTFIQLETVRLTLKQGPGLRGLIILPLNVHIEFRADAAKLGIDVKFIRTAAAAAAPGIYLTNYETVRDGKLDPNLFDVVSLDEASLLRSYGSKTTQTFLALFRDIPHRFVATATPSPNRYKELIHYSGFLGIMDTGQALTRFFQRDSTKANNLTLYPHKEREFWLWVATWAVFLQRPSDLGYSDEGYDLPELDIHWHQVAVDHSAATADRDGQGHLFRGGSLDLTGAAREKRLTLDDRVAELVGIIIGYEVSVDDQAIAWCQLNDEQTAIERELTAAGISFSSVHGGLTVAEAEKRLEAWRHRETAVLIGKPVMLGQGMNLQQANKAVWVGITDHFEELFQSIHRVQRFGQTRTVHAHFIYAESETEIRSRFLTKWNQHKGLTANMSSIIREYGLSTTEISDALKRAIGVERIEASGEGWLVANNDCVVETRDHMATDSVDLIVTSIPFSNHYEYTPSYNDFGHTDDNAHFWAQMDYLTPELLRVLKPGRIYACHVKDRILFGNVTGAGIPTVSPFHMEATFHAREHGFDYIGMITVSTDVVRENNQTYRLGYTEMCKDGSKMGVGSPEYILLFHKPQTDRSKGYADDRIVKSKDEYSLARWQLDADSTWRSSGDRPLTTDELAALPPEDISRIFTQQSLREVYDYEAHVRIGDVLLGRGRLPSTFMALQPGSPLPDVWHDVNRMLTLNTEQSQRAQAMHVCPLQFDIVDRLIRRYSNPGDLVYDPFGGLFTVPLRAMKLGRAGRAAELNPGYFLDGVKYLQAEERNRAMPTLFDLDDHDADASLVDTSIT